MSAVDELHALHSSLSAALYVSLQGDPLVPLGASTRIPNYTFLSYGKGSLMVDFTSTRCLLMRPRRHFSLSRLLVFHPTPKSHALK